MSNALYLIVALNIIIVLKIIIILMIEIQYVMNICSRKTIIFNKRSRNIAFVYYYRVVLGSPHMCQWSGRKGTAANIYFEVTLPTIQVYPTISLPHIKKLATRVTSWCYMDMVACAAVGNNYK